MPDEKQTPSQQYASNLDTFTPKLYTSPAAVLKSPTAHSLLQLEPGTECPICLSKVVSIESLGAYGWRCSCATCYEVTDTEDPIGPSCCSPCEDSIEQAVEVWLEEMREFAEVVQDVRIPFVPTAAVWADC